MKANNSVLFCYRFINPSAFAQNWVGSVKKSNFAAKARRRTGRPAEPELLTNY